MRRYEQPTALKLAVSRLEKWSYRCRLRSPRGLCLPHFLGIGAQKAGTTWLDRNLRCHPDLYLPAQKELHYFDRHFVRSLDHYSRQFRDAGTRIRGEITPSYAVLPPPTIRFIRAVMPEVRLILLLRNPVDRAWSHAMMRLVKRRKRRLEDVPEAELLAQLQSPESRGKSSYLTVLDHWLAAFPAAQLHVAFFQEIVESPRELLAGILRHIGASTEVSWEDFPLSEVIGRGVGAGIPEPCRELLEGLYADEIRGLYGRFGEKVRPWMEQVSRVL